MRRVFKSAIRHGALPALHSCTLAAGFATTRNLVFSGIVLACGMAGTAQAASTLLSAPVVGGQQQARVACVLVNWNPTTSINFVTKELVGQFTALTPDFDNCGASLGKKSTCSFQTNVNVPGAAPHQAASCKVVILEAKTNVRGIMVALDPAGGRPLSQTDLR
jgi:hypothetical protein